MTRLLATSLLVALAVPATAAAKPSGVVTIELGRATNVRVSGVAPAAASRSGITLPVSGGGLSALQHRGAVRLRAGRRVLTLRRLRTGLGQRPALSAVVGGRRLTLLRAPRTTLRIDGDDVSAQATVALTRAGAAALRRGLGLARPRLSGRLRVAATVPGAEPVVLPRPDSAVDLQAATIAWHVRDSFIQYMAAGEGTSASGGATAGPPTVRPGSDASLVYDFGFVFRDGWADAKSGKAVARFRGTVRFYYKAHRIALRASDPEIELDGARSRAIFRVGSGSAASRRAVLVDLDLAKAKVAGDTREIPGTIPASATSSVFAGYYLPGDPFGWITLRLGS